MNTFKQTIGLIGAAGAIIISGCGDDAATPPADTTTMDTAEMDTAGADTGSGDAVGQDATSTDDTTVADDTATPDDTTVADDTTAAEETTTATDTTVAQDVVVQPPLLTANLALNYQTSTGGSGSNGNLNCRDLGGGEKSSADEIDDGGDKLFRFYCIVEVPGSAPWALDFGARNPDSNFNVVAALPQDGPPRLIAGVRVMTNAWNLGTGVPDFAVRVIFTEYSSEDRRAVGSIDYKQRTFLASNPDVPTFSVTGTFTASW